MLFRGKYRLLLWTLFSLWELYIFFHNYYCCLVSFSFSILNFILLFRFFGCVNFVVYSCGVFCCALLFCLFIKLISKDSLKCSTCRFIVREFIKIFYFKFYYFKFVYYIKPIQAYRKYILKYDRFCIEVSLKVWVVKF